MVSRLKLTVAWFIRPATLSLGAIIKLKSSSFYVWATILIADKKKAVPAFGFSSKLSGRNKQRVLFSPNKGTISATVAIATTSRSHFSQPGTMLNLPILMTAQIVLKLSLPRLKIWSDRFPLLASSPLWRKPWADWPARYGGLLL